MNKYYCTVLFDASSNIIVEASTPEEAAEKAEYATEGNQRLCHQCADTLDTGDITGVLVHDKNETKELLDTRYQPQRTEQEPVIFCMHWEDRWGCNHYADPKEPHPANAKPLYTHPPQQEKGGA